MTKKSIIGTNNPSKMQFKHELNEDRPINGEDIWDFDMPKYDQRSSCFISAGTDYGVGKNQPVGSEKVTMKGEVPKGCYRIDVTRRRK